MKKLAKCPDCNEEGKVTKKWSYGPKTRKGPSFDVTLYACKSGHKWRSYAKINVEKSKP